MQIPTDLFLCAGAILESPRLAKESPVTQNLQCCLETPRRRLNGDPGVPKCAPRLPKVFQRGHKGSQKRDKRSAMRSPEHALALQSAFKGVLYTPKLPINRTSGHYVSDICCGIISTITFGLLLLSLVLIPSPLHYYPYYCTTTGGGWWGLVCPARPPERLPRLSQS